MWFVYIVQNLKGHFYTGITTDVSRRFQEHQQSKKGAKFFRSSPAVQIVFQKEFPNRSLATKYEIFVKKLKRHQKIELMKLH